MCDWLKKHQGKDGRLTYAAFAEAAGKNERTITRWANCNSGALPETYYQKLAEAIDREGVTAQTLKQDHQRDLDLIAAAKAAANSLVHGQPILDALQRFDESSPFLAELLKKEEDLEKAAARIVEGLSSEDENGVERFLSSTFNGLFEKHIPNARAHQELDAFDHLIRVLVMQCMVAEAELHTPGVQAVSGSESAAMKRAAMDAGRGKTPDLMMAENISALADDPLSLVACGDDLELETGDRVEELVRQLVDLVDYEGGPLPPVRDDPEGFEAYCSRFNARYLFNQNDTALYAFVMCLPQEPQAVRDALAEKLSHLRIQAHNGAAANPHTRVDDEEILQGWIAMSLERVQRRRGELHADPPGTITTQSRPEGAGQLPQQGEETMKIGDIINIQGDATVAIAKDQAQARAKSIKQLPPGADEYLVQLRNLIAGSDRPEHLAIEGTLARIESGEPDGGRLLEKVTKGVELTGKMADVVTKLIPLLG